mmetsp:Transcript_16985/g.23755  ORF Transcript_16985/g.23755 Transcript_16985/m.23755 type:complete len:417 (-) Transcript_16985:190-1440(-)|eukprot:CAMPEP_0184490956 /NCGR_PEP_ID=MMETSP0113_2-20130426/19278_1 /TAXON_ID=91329 /ORGANISM="Norrisiella sphaerica, Strain BC52" /LENGTH=416 /DNA_ID=CAMNT_0026875101 /DNA_START=113 /DNA_END=1363 /DNA_ORIENTATION=-
MSIAQFLGRVRMAIAKCMGNQAARLLRLKVGVPAHVISTVHAQAMNKARTLSMAKQIIGDPWGPIVGFHIYSKALSRSGRHTEALDAALEAGKLCRSIMSAAEPPEHTPNSLPNWYLPMVDALLGNIRLIAFDADKDNMQSPNQRKAYGFICEYLSLCNKKDKAKGLSSKKMATIFTVNHLFKLCFRLNLLRNTSQLTLSVNSKGFPPMENFPKSETVTYHFYLGRLKMMEEKYEEAEEYLEYAFIHCHKNCRPNKLRVLQFLIPVKVLLKKMPSGRLFEKYPLRQYKEVIRSVKSGNLKEYNQLIRKYEEYFVQKGVFLLMERLKIYVYRNLVKKVALYNRKYRENPKKKEHILDFNLIKAAFQMNGMELDEENYDEIECILSNLIYEGLVKGYIAHDHKCLVLAKRETREPFPI